MKYQVNVTINWSNSTKKEFSDSFDDINLCNKFVKQLIDIITDLPELVNSFNISVYDTSKINPIDTIRGDKIDQFIKNE